MRRYFRRWLRPRLASAGEQVQLGGEPAGHLQGLVQVGVADDHHAVGDQGRPPVPPRRADREQVDRGDVVAVLGQQPVQALERVIRPTPWARSRDAGDVTQQWGLLPQMVILDVHAGRVEDAAAHLREGLQVAVRTGGWIELSTA